MKPFPPRNLKGLGGPDPEKIAAWKGLSTADRSCSLCPGDTAQPGSEGDSG